VVIVVLGLLNVVDIRVARASLIVGPVVVAGLTGIARLAGLSWQDLGLGPGTWRPGLRWAAVEIAIVGLVLAAAATLVSSALSGLWHVLPSLGLSANNQAITGTVGTGKSAQTTTVLATVLFTAVSGVVFCEVRRRSGSILASAGLHWATNGLSVLASAAVWARATR
jgi:hypothetical protein